MSARTRFLAGPIRGRTHRSAPTWGGRYSETREIGVKRTLPQRGGTEPAPYRRMEADQRRGAPRGRRGAPRVWLPPAKFRNGIWGVSHGHPALRKHHWWYPAAGRCGHRPLRKAQASRRAAKRPRQRGRGMGGNRRKDHPQKGTAPATAQAALSEAESAERAAGQIQVLPDDLRVQHGAQGSEASAKPRPCSRRGCVN